MNVEKYKELLLPIIGKSGQQIFKKIFRRVPNNLNFLEQKLNKVNSS